MGEPALQEIPSDGVKDHPSARAWRHIRRERVVPERIEVLKDRPGSSIFRLVGAGPERSAVIAKRCPAITGNVEIIVYEKLMPRLPVAGPRLLGSRRTRDGWCWLFLEDATAGTYSQDDASHRALAARWLAAVHALDVAPTIARRLPSRKPAHYLRILQSSRTILLRHLHDPALRAEDLALVRSVVSCLDLLEDRWGEIDAFCATLPRLLVHGDLVIKNVSVREAQSDRALLVFDWENAGWGVPGTDLCQFTGRTLSPDLDVYCGASTGASRLRDPHNVVTLAGYGRLFRVLDDIGWIVPNMVFGAPTYLSKPMSYLRSFEPLLRIALAGAPWRRHDRDRLELA